MLTFKMEMNIDLFYRIGQIYGISIKLMAKWSKL